MKNYKILVRFFAFSAFIGAFLFIIPGTIPALGSNVPASHAWQMLIGMLLVFASVVVFYASRDLEKHGAIVFWNGIIRIVFCLTYIFGGMSSTAGNFFTLIVIWDSLTALTLLIATPIILKRSPINLLLLK